MRIPEKMDGKIVFAVQAVLVLLYVPVHILAGHPRKKKRARRVQQQEEKEAVRYTKAKYRQKERI